MKLHIASDHAGFESKEKLKTELSAFESLPGKFEQIEWIDHGTHSLDSSDYPLNAAALCQAILKDGGDNLEPKGVLICGSGIGVSISANRFKGIRAVLALTPEIAQLSRQHNAANVICFGQRVMSVDTMKECLKTFLSTEFEGRKNERHARRVRQMDEIK